MQEKDIEVEVEEEEEDSEFKTNNSALLSLFSQRTGDKIKILKVVNKEVDKELKSLLKEIVESLYQKNLKEKKTITTNDFQEIMKNNLIFKKMLDGTLLKNDNINLIHPTNEKDDDDNLININDYCGKLNKIQINFLEKYFI